MPKDEELGIEHTSGLTDADWAEINRLSRAYDSGGDDALLQAFRHLMKDDPVRALRVWGAFFPHKASEALRDAAAALGISEEDIREAQV